MSEIWEFVEGSRSDHEVSFFGLSTCGWCKKTRRFLEDSDVSFRYVSVDLIPKELQGKVIEQLSKWNPSRNFPTIVIDDEKVVVGYSPDSLKKELGL